jgi:hypothetical protein
MTLCLDAMIDNHLHKEAEKRRLHRKAEKRRKRGSGGIMALRFRCELIIA